MARIARLSGPRRAVNFVLAPWCRQVALVEVSAALAWVLYAYLSVQGAGHATRAASTIWWCMPDMRAAVTSGDSLPALVAAALPMWLLILAAMVLPGVLPAAQHVATNTFRRRRSAAVGVFLGVHLLVWLAFGAIATLLLAAWGSSPEAALFGVVLAAAAVYELTAAKRWALNRCHRTRPLPPRGVRGFVAVAGFGWVNASGCVASCWLSMLAMLTAPYGRPLVMIALTAAMTYERLTRRPRSGRRRIAASYTGIAAMFALAAF